MLVKKTLRLHGSNRVENHFQIVIIISFFGGYDAIEKARELQKA